MPQAAIAFGVSLCLLGGSFYAVSGAPTALVPAVIGLVLIAAGAAARRPGWRAHAMHAAALAGTLGVLGGVPGLVRMPAFLSGATVPRPLAAVEQALTALLCLAFVVLCVRSFRNARRANRV